MKRLPFRTLRHAVTVPAVKAVIFTAVVTPRWLSRVNARILGVILSILPLPSNRILERNRQSVMRNNGIKVNSAAVYASILTGFFDFFHLSCRSDSTFKNIVHISGAENMAEALSPGRGAIAVTAHFSAWELLPRAIKLLGFDVGVVGRSLSQKGTSEVLEKLRRKPGIKTVDRDAGASPVLRLLRSNHALGMLIDQNTKGVQSETVDFLGSPAPTPVSPAVLAVKLNVPVVTLHLTRNSDSTYTLEIDKPLYFGKDDSVSKILSILNDRISRWILDAPEQWVWFHDRWRV